MSFVGKLRKGEEEAIEVTDEGKAVEVTDTGSTEKGTSFSGKSKSIKKQIRIEKEKNSIEEYY